MHPSKTLYRLAHSPHDYKRCHRLFESENIEAEQLSWPTIMALRDDVLVGCLSTIPHKSAIIAGPIAVVTPRPFLAIMRLTEAYERVLMLSGINVYLFGIDLDQHLDWMAIVTKFGLTPYHLDQKVAWFERRIA